MSIFKTRQSQADRSASDRKRHRGKISEAIKDGIHHIVSDESIIGQDGKKRIKIPVRGIKEYRFVYGENSKKSGVAPGKNIRRGQTVGKKKKRRTPGEEGAGNERGEEFYEVEITLEELSDYLFDSLNLPDLEKKKFKKLIGEKIKRKGYRKSGIRPRLSKKETLKNKIRRKKVTERIKKEDDKENETEERFPFHKSDLKFKHFKKSKKESNSAVIFFMMDTSGSMTTRKKFIARSFFFLLYHFIKSKYENVEIVFISHDAEAREVNEDDFFKKGNSGGTIISSALELCLEIINQRYHRDSWNVYSFHCSDGDNWPTDIEKSIKLSEKLKEQCQLYSFIQISPIEQIGWLDGGMASKYFGITDHKFKTITLETPDQIWDAFKGLFGGEIS